MKKKNKNNGILFWITGLSGSGKTAVATKIKNDIQKLYGPTIVVSGDNLRKIFGFNKYTPKERIELSRKYNNFAKFITNRRINLIFTVVAMIDSARDWNRANIDNYIEIYIKTNIKKIINFKKKKIYFFKSKKNIVGLDIQPQFPKKPDIIVINDFNKSITDLKNEILIKINKHAKHTL